MTTTEIYRGATGKICVEAYNDDDTAIDLTGYTGQMAIVRNFQDEKIEEFIVAIELPNKITCTISADKTRNLPTKCYATLQVSNSDTGDVIVFEEFKIIVKENANL